MKRKITAIMLALIMTVALFPALPVYAAATTITSGGGDQSGTGWAWVAGTKTLTLSGSADIPADEITFSGAFGTGYITINDTYTGATPTINFNNFSITGSTAGAPVYGSAIVIPDKGGIHPIIFNFTGTNTIRGMNNSTTSGGAAIRRLSYGSLTINGVVDLIGGNSTRTDADNDASGGYGIVNYYGDVTINATGAVNVTGGNGGGGYAGTGIYAYGYEVTINGSGAVNITTGDKTGNTSLGNGSAILATDISLNNPNTIIRGGDSYSASSSAMPGIDVRGTLTITESVTITGGDAKVAATGEYKHGSYGIISTGLIDIKGSGLVTITGGRSSGTVGNGGDGIALYNTGSLNIVNPNTIITGGNGSGSGTNLGFAGSAVYINNDTQIITLPYSNISKLVAGTGNTNGSKIFIGTNYFDQTSGKYNTLAEMKTNPTQIIFTGTAPIAPDAPTAVTATAGNGLASVSFTPPSADGGSPVTSYTVTSSPDGKTATGAASPLIVTGLTNGTAYTFTVTATNDVGTGISSAASGAVTPFKPVTSISGAPTTGTVGTGLALSGTVAPIDATNKTIVWSVKSGTATMTGTNEVTATAAGDVVVTATITNGLTASTNYTQDFTIAFSNAYKAVTGITGPPTTGTVGTGLALSGTVAPTDATNKTIVWSVKSGTATMTGTNEVTATAAGDVVVTATVLNGATASTNYTQDFTITVSSAGTKIYTISADTALINFGSLTTGYGSAPASQTVTITNTGNQTITLTEPATTNASSNYSIGALSKTSLDAGDKATFTLQPKTGLAVGTYNETIQIAGTESAATSVSVQFSVTSAGGSGSGGGGSSNITKATSVINTNTGSVTGNQLSNAAAAAKEGETVTIKSNETDEVTLPTSGLDSLSDRNNSLTVVTEKGTLIFNSKAVDAMGTQATDDDIKVIVDDVVKTALTEAQQTEVGDKTVYDLTVMSGGKLISNFNGGKVTVSIPYDLKSGETAEDLKVWYMADNGSLTEINCTYDTKTKAVTFVVEHFSKYIIGYDEVTGWVNPFTDVKSSAWYYDAAVFVNTNGLMKGQTDTTFAPQTVMTRGMFVTILGRMEGIDATLYASKNTFSDVKSNQYYAPYIAWATEKGIVSGMGGDKFAPNSAVTREQMAVMMTNYMKAIGQGPTGEWAIQLTYSDLDQVSSWADEAVMFMTMKDLMNGTGNDTTGKPLFAPKSTSTRAQTAQVMMSLGELLN